MRRAYLLNLELGLAHKIEPDLVLDELPGEDGEGDGNRGTGAAQHTARS
jgi:hypothetical protein